MTFLPTPGGTLIYGNRPSISSLAAHYLEHEQPGSTKMIKIESVNTLYNRLKNGVSNSNNINNKINTIPQFTKHK
jgi:hypothetical protein